MRDSLKYQMIHLLSYLFLAKYSQIKQKEKLISLDHCSKKKMCFFSSNALSSGTLGVYIGYVSSLHLENLSSAPRIFLCGVCMYIKLFLVRQ